VNTRTLSVVGALAAIMAFPLRVRRSHDVLLRKGRRGAAAMFQLKEKCFSSAIARPSLLATCLMFVVMAVPVIMFLTCLSAALGVLPPALVGSGTYVMAETTGTKTGSGSFSGLNDMLKQVYTKAFENNVEKDSEVADLIQRAEGFEIVDGPDGKQINIGHIFSSGGGVGSMNEDDYLYTPTPPTTKTSAITIKQHVAVVELSGRTLRRVKKGPAAFVSWADKALPMKAQRLAFHKDRQYLGTGTGVICRMNGTPDGTGDPIDNMFGISGLDDRATHLLLRDDPIRLGPNANGSSLRTGNLVVGLVDYTNKAINTVVGVGGSAGTATSAADNDYVFLGDGNVQGSGSREMMGLEGIIDDGTNVATFQGLTRASYPELNAQIVDSSASGWDQTLSEEILDYGDSLAFERGNMGKPSVILVNRSGQRSFWKNLKNDRTINDPRGTYQGGKNRLKMMLGDRLVTIAAGRKVPESRAYGIDTSGIHRYTIGKGRWDDTDGDIWNRVVDGTGRKDAFFAVYVEEEELGADNPAGSFKITNLLAA
jgi:hypothetical protein